jgi:uncharacterized protein
MNMRVLVICDDRWHPAETVRGGLAPLAGEYDFDWIENAGDWSAEKLADYPVVLFSKSNNVSQEDQNDWMTPEVEQAFRDYVHNGGGLFVVHSGTAGYKETPVLRALMGGIFEHHPPQCPVTMHPQAGHPLAKGAEPFTLVDEHYFMAVDDTDADVYMSTTSEHGEQPGAWTLSRGAGRVCVLTPGHLVEVWLHPSFQALLRNGIEWCAGQ